MHRFAAALLLFVAATPAAALLDTSQPGKLAVGVATLDAVDVRRDRTLRSEIWYPAKTAGRDATPKKKTYPLIMVAPCGSRLDYEYLATHLASHGFVVAAVDLRGLSTAVCASGQEPAGFDDLKYDLSFVCRELHEVDGQLGQYAKQVRGVPTGVVGHSLGSSVAFEAAELDTFFTTVLGLANWLADGTSFDDLSPVRNWMVQGATGDTNASYTGFTEPFFNGFTTSPVFLVRVTGGSHFGFSDADATLTPDALAAQQAAVKRTATPFFLKYLSRRHKFGKQLRPFDDGSVALVPRP